MIQLEPRCETAGCYHRLVRYECSGEIGDECTGFCVVSIRVYFILFYFVGELAFVLWVKQGWRRCVLLLAEPLSCPDMGFLGGSGWGRTAAL